MCETNRFIKNSKATMFNIPGASSHQILHYFDGHLKGGKISTVVIRVGINDVVRDSSESSFAKIKNMSINYRKVVVKNIFISGLVYRTRIIIGWYLLVIQR